MTGPLLPFSAAAASFLLAIASLIRKKRSFAGNCFTAGMAAYAVQNLFSGIALMQEPDAMLRWRWFAMLVAALATIIWLAFSLTFSRGNYREFLKSWKIPLIVLLIVPPVLLVLSPPLHPSEESPDWFKIQGLGKLANGILLATNVLILMNLEKTFRATVGTQRWRIKFIVLGLGLIIAVKIFARTQTMLFSAQNLDILSLDWAAVVLGCIIIAFGSLRSGFSEVDIYPSHAVLSGSLTILLAGSYLFIVGILAQFIAYLGGPGNFQAQSFFVLLALTALAILFFSERFREKMKYFVSRHLKAPRHDFRKVWVQFSQSTAGKMNVEDLCITAARLTSDTFHVLSVTIWVYDSRMEALTLGGTTSKHSDEISSLAPARESSLLIKNKLHQLRNPLPLEKCDPILAAELRKLSPAQFPSGERRACVPLWSSDRFLGMILLADRVYGIPYTAEEFDLLRCMGAQLCDDILNLQLSQKLVETKELEAFQTVSAFFVHDLKNTASSLGLMLKNLPVHFADPAFREDALRGVGKTVDRINQLIEGLGVLKDQIHLQSTPTSLRKLLEESIEQVKLNPEIRVEEELLFDGTLSIDREKIREVFTNILNNSADAMQGRGEIRVRLEKRDASIIVTFSDSGCGMSPAFLRNSLFRPFQTTKKKGLGIGMFQSRLVVEAHGGTIQVESQQGHGSTFRILIPTQLES